jgi:predicted alpha/beta superfamily hydrolase
MVTARAVQLPGSEVHALHSEAVGDDFEISVFAPPPGVEGPVPVVYFTDANIGVGVAANTVNLLQMGGEIPPVRLVCVGYPIGDDFEQFLRLRTRDFMSTGDATRESGMSEMSGLEVKGGGADAFLEFLTSELRPWVAANYDVTDDSTLIGDSMGGLFATYTLLHQPSAFRRYVIGSPWLCWNRDVSTAYEAQYAGEHADLDATVFLCAGADEEVLPPAMPEPMVGQFRGADTAELTRQLAAGLESRGYPSLRLTTRIFPEETHFTIPPILVAHGLRSVFAVEREG